MPLPWPTSVLAYFLMCKGESKLKFKEGVPAVRRRAKGGSSEHGRMGASRVLCCVPWPPSTSIVAAG